MEADRRAEVVALAVEAVGEAGDEAKRGHLTRLLVRFCVLEELGPHLICSQLKCLFAVLPEPNAVIFS